MAALNRFLSRSAVRGLPFFKVLKNGDKFQWNQACQEAFDDLKKYLNTLPTLTAPEPAEQLYVYLSSTPEVVSAVLVKEAIGVQKPVYYMSKALNGPELRYTVVEKLILSLVHTARQLKRYFISHPICVMTDQPIRHILTKPEASGRMVKWAVELGEYDLTYTPRTAIKAQALANFIAKLTPVDKTPKTEASSEHWTLYVDGSANSEGSGAGLLLSSPTGEELTYALRFDFRASNNEAEYEALITGLRLAKELGARRIQVASDSQLLVKQVLGKYAAREDNMQKYLSKVEHLIKDFDAFKIERVS